MIDLWGDEPSDRVSRAVVETKISTNRDVVLQLEGQFIKISSRPDLTQHRDFRSLIGVSELRDNPTHSYSIPLRPVNAYVLRHILKDYTIQITPQAAKQLTQEADKVSTPVGRLSETGKHVELQVPPLEVYREVLRTVNGYPLQNGMYRVPIGKVLDLETLSASVESSLPKIKFTQEVRALTRSSIPGFDGTIESLKTIPVGELNVVKANSQAYKNMKKSKKTLEEKLSDFGISTLYDLLTWLPKRYIDKSSPQEIRDLMVDEPATIIGTVVASENMPRNMGVSFQIETESGRGIRVSFWRQQWLKNKFKIGSEVLVTGKYTPWKGQPQLNGTSIEDAKEAAMLPVVPVYKQSESRGITTTFLLSAVRELFSRLGPIPLPSYLAGENRPDYYEAFKELHIPSTLDNHSRIIDSLAYYELVMMQLLMQETKERSVARPGIPMSQTSLDLQAQAVAALPFQLTNSQIRAVDSLNEKLADKRPSTTLLNADVGAGKTLVAQLACLRAVEAGYQAVLVGPTEVLARQLYETFDKLGRLLEERGERVNIAYLSARLKAAEKKKVLAAVKSGEVDIVVGTHSTMGSTVEYKNLGFVAIDEQQKFGAEQRTTLLNSRSDGKIPDLLMQTATPIPRSTAQVFYGDIDMLLLDEKPPGRLPIITKWVEEDPQEVIAQGINPMWSDIRAEAMKGNQTFVITPMVRESSSIDAASVERTFKALSESVFAGLRVGFVHGQMKGDGQKEAMQAFRQKEYDVLVASTVVEVGVDIPDATRVVILSADRMGASSLHQIRGRVGRNDKQSVCYLVSLGRTENSRIRLQSLVDSEDGFEVAKADLFTRGEGKVFSGNQSGASDLMFASLVRHGKWVKQARKEALDILASNERESALEDCRKHFASEGRLV